jgi:predicted DNA-binding antitoxin AbrB/MazE fold protein
MEIDAVYKNGVLTPECELPLTNGQRVRLTIHVPSGIAQRSHGLIQWNGDQADLDYLLGPPNQPFEQRVAGLHPNSAWVSDDFDASLPEDFWTGSS